MAITVDAVLGADVSGFVSGMGKAQQAFSDTAKTINGGTNAMGSSLQNTTNASNAFSDAALKMGVAIGAAGFALISFSRNAFSVAADVAEMNVAMDAVGKSSGVGGQAIHDAANAVRKQGIEMKASQEIALLFVKSNLDLADASKLARVAQDFAVLSQRNSTDVAKTLAYAIQTGNSMLLKGVGITKYAGEAYSEYATTLGKSANNLTNSERQQAILNMVMAEGAKVAGTYEAAMGQSGKVLRSFPRIINDIQLEFGNLFLDGFGPVILSAYQTLKQFSLLIREGGALHPIILALTESFTTLISPLQGVFEKMKHAMSMFQSGSFDIQAISARITELLPMITALAVGLSAFSGKKIIGDLPVFGNVLKSLTENISPLGLGIATLILMSPELRAVFMDLVKSLEPLLPVVMDLGQTIMDSMSKVMEAIANVAQGMEGSVVSILTGLVNAISAISVVVLPVVNGLASLLTILTANKVVMAALLPIIMAVVVQKKLLGTNADGSAKALTRLVTGFKKFGSSIQESIRYQKALATGSGETITTFQALKAAGVSTFTALKAEAQSLMASLGPMILAMIAIQLIFAAISAFGAKQKENAARTKEMSEALRDNTKALMENKDALTEGADGHELLSDAIFKTGEDSAKLVTAFGQIGQAASLEKFTAAHDNFKKFAEEILVANGATKEAAKSMAEYINGTDDNDFNTLQWAALDTTGQFKKLAKALEEIQDQIEKTNFDKIVQDQVDMMMGSGQITKDMIIQAQALADADAATYGYGQAQTDAAFSNYLMKLATDDARLAIEASNNAVATGAEVVQMLAISIWGTNKVTKEGIDPTKALTNQYLELQVANGGAAVSLEDFAKKIQGSYRDTISLARANKSLAGSVKSATDEILSGKQSWEDFKLSAYDIGDAILTFNKNLVDQKLPLDEVASKTAEYVQNLIGAAVQAGWSKEAIKEVVDAMNLIDGTTAHLYFDLSEAQKALAALAAVYSAIYLISTDTAGMKKMTDAMREAQIAVDSLTKKAADAGKGKGGGSKDKDPFAWVKGWVDNLVTYANDEISSSTLGDLLGLTSEQTTGDKVRGVFKDLNAQAEKLGLQNIPAVASALADLKTKYEELAKIAEKRDLLLGSIEETKQKIAELQSVVSDLTSTLHDLQAEAGKISQDYGLDIVGAILPTDSALDKARAALTEYQRLVDERNTIIQNAHEYATQVATSMMPPLSESNTVARASKVLRQAQEFRDGILEMRDRGFPKDMIAEVIGAGVVQGGKLARGLLAMSAGDLSELVGIRAQIAGVAVDTATAATNIMFDPAQIEEINTAIATQGQLVTDLWGAVISTATTALTTAQAELDAQNLLLEDLNTQLTDANTAMATLIDTIKIKFHDALFEFLAGFNGAIDRLGTPSLTGATPFALGGIVTMPTIGLVGEAGAEAIIPLSQLGSMGTTNVYVTVQGSVSSEKDLVEAVRVGLVRSQKSGRSLLI
jgi:hypothetical protein